MMQARRSGLFYLVVFNPHSYDQLKGTHGRHSRSNLAGSGGKAGCMASSGGKAGCMAPSGGKEVGSCVP